MCPVCGGEMKLAFSAVVLNKYDAVYEFCSNCGFLGIQEPFWLEEAYTDAIASTDTGLVSRNIQISHKIASILYFLFSERGVGSYVDAAGGYGMLVRALRDHGMDFYWSDKYCQNLFAKGFEESDMHQKPKGYTAIEVMEHLEDPCGFVDHICQTQKADFFAFTTELFNGQPPHPDNWWYYARETGQHISFFQRRTLETIAKRVNMRFYSSGGLHLFSKKRVNLMLFQLLTSKLSYFFALFVKQRLGSRVNQDHADMVDRLAI